MPDMSFFPDGFQQAAPAIKPAAKHVAAHASHAAVMVKPVIHHAALTVHKGFSMLTLFITSVANLGVGFGLGWYVKSRGVAGIKLDIADVKADVQVIKDKLNPRVSDVAGPTSAPVVVVAPAA